MENSRTSRIDLSEPRSPFCAVAGEYDRKFTHQPLGVSKRRLVHEYLAPLLSPESRVLELNCGTGEDAVILSAEVASILSTDASGEMIRVAREKAEGSELPPREGNSPRFAVATIENIASGASDVVEEELATRGPFDVVFSNFDGFNCVEQHDRIAIGLLRTLRPGGHLILVFMTRHPLLEKVRDLLRGRFGRVVAGRGGESGGMVPIGSGNTIRTWFPSVRGIERAFMRAGFIPRDRRAIGLFLPPTTMNDFYGRHRRIFDLLERLERPLAGLPVLNRCGDHVLLHLVRPEMCENR